MEKRLTKKFDEQCHQVKEAIESVVQQTAQQISGNLSQLLTVSKIYFDNLFLLLILFHMKIIPFFPFMHVCIKKYIYKKICME